MTDHVKRSWLCESSYSYEETQPKRMRSSSTQVAVERFAKAFAESGEGSPEISVDGSLEESGDGSPEKSSEGSPEQNQELKLKDESSPVDTSDVRQVKIAKVWRVPEIVNGFRSFKGAADVAASGLTVPSTTKLEQRPTVDFTELNFRFKSTYYTDVLKPDHLPWVRWNGLEEFAKLDWIKDRVPMTDLVDVVRSFNPVSRMCSLRGIDLQLTKQYLKKTFRLLGEDVKQPKPPQGWISDAFPAQPKTRPKKGYYYTRCTDPLVQERLGFVQLTLHLSFIRSDASGSLIFMVEDNGIREKGWIGMFCTNFWQLMHGASAEVIQLRLAPHIRILFDEPEWTAQLPKQVKLDQSVEVHSVDTAINLDAVRSAVVKKPMDFAKSSRPSTIIKFVSESVKPEPEPVRGVEDAPVFAVKEGKLFVGPTKESPIIAKVVINLGSETMPTPHQERGTDDTPASGNGSKGGPATLSEGLKDVMHTLSDCLKDVSDALESIQTAWEKDDTEESSRGDSPEEMSDTVAPADTADFQGSEQQKDKVPAVSVRTANVEEAEQVEVEVPPSVHAPEREAEQEDIDDEENPFVDEKAFRYVYKDNSREFMQYAHGVVESLKTPLDALMHSRMETHRVTADFANFRISIAETVRDMQSAIDKLTDEKSYMEITIEILEQSRKIYQEEEKQQGDQWKAEFEWKKLQPLRDHLQELKKLSEADQAEIAAQKAKISDLNGQLASEVRTHLESRDRVKSLEEEIAEFGKVKAKISDLNVQLASEVGTHLESRDRVKSLEEEIAEFGKVKAKISDLDVQLASEVRTHLESRERVKSLEEEIAEFGKVKSTLEYAASKAYDDYNNSELRHMMLMRDYKMRYTDLQDEHKKTVEQLDQARKEVADNKKDLFDIFAYLRSKIQQLTAGERARIGLEAFW